jgi:hypothetical protein
MAQTKEKIKKYNAFYYKKHKKKHNAHSKAYYENNKESCKACQKRYAFARKEGISIKKRAEHLKRAYGITIEQYDTMLKNQEGKCLICSEFETVIDPRTGKVKSLSVDHNHETGEIRGLLCRRCNIGLSYFKESSGLLKRASFYLESYKK